MSQLPPIYSPSSPAPIYSATPARDESVLQYTPLHGQGHRPTGTFVQSDAFITVVLDGQKENISRPSFGRGAPLSGTIFLAAPETATMVTINFEGILESLSPSHGYTGSKIAEYSSCLYSRRSGAQAGQCPSAIRFAHRFPITCKTDGGEGSDYPLPPSCDISLPGGSFLKCTYSLTVSITAAIHRSALFSFLVKDKRLCMELDYRQRTRPSRPRVNESSLLSTIKICPEEWLQLPIGLTTAAPDRELSASDMHCDLFVPSVGVFGISEVAIPFHLQVSGPVQVLRVLMGIHEKGERNATGNESPICVCLLRQIQVTRKNAGITKINTVLSNGSLRPLPPQLISQPSGSHALNWEGEVQLQDSGTPSFDAGTFKVIYLISVEIRPPKASLLNRAHYGFPIKLTTDTWDGSAEQSD